MANKRGASIHIRAAAWAAGLLWAFVALPAAHAATCTSQSSGNWNVAARWNCGGAARVPLTTDSAVVAAAHTVTLNQNATIQQITVNGTLNTDNNSRVLTLTTTSPLFTVGGSGSFVPGNSTVVMNGAANFTLTSGAVTFNDLTLSPSGNRTYTFGNAPITINGDLTIIRNGAGSGSFVVNMAAAITVGGMIDVQGGSNNNRLAVLHTHGFALTAGRILLNADARGRLTAYGSTITLNGTAGPLFTATSTNFSEDTSTVVMNSAASVSLNAGSPSFYNLTVNMPGQTGSLGAQFHVQNALSIVAGTVNMGGHLITSNESGARSMTMATGTNLIIGSGGAAGAFPTGFPTEQISLAAGSTVTYAAAADQTVSHTPIYANLNLGTGSGTKTPSGALDVNGDLTIGANNNLAGMSFNHTLAGNFVNNGTLFGNTSTFSFDGNAAQTISGSASTSFTNVEIANTSAPVSVASNISASGTFTVNSGATLAPLEAIVVSGGGTLTGSGTIRITRTAGTSNLSDQYTITNKTLTNLTAEYAGASAQTISAIVHGGLTLNNAAGASLQSGTTTVGGTLTLSNGTLAVGSQTLALNGPAIAGTSANLLTTSASSLSFGGSSAGVFLPSHIAQLNSLTLNNANGLSLSNPLSVTSLVLTNGVIDMAGNTLTVTGPCTTNVTRTTGYVQSAVRLTFPAAASTCVFHVGTGNAYAPITVVKPATGAPGALTGSTVGSEHAEIASSPINATKNVNRHWLLTDDTINAANYGVTLGFISGDVDVGAATAEFIVGRHNGTTWTSPDVGTRTSTSTATTSTAVIGPLTAASFAVGEAVFVCSTPNDVPASMSCVCDNFGRSNLNPSSIFGGNWALSSSSGTFGVPQIVNSGFLRLTNNSTNVSTAATLPGSFPAAGNMITIDFRLFAYNGSGADGIALTLSDASVNPVPGAYGGSLGYAQKDNANCAAPPCNGFAGGWVGIGVDAFGNFSNPTEGRSRNPTGAPSGSFPNEGARVDAIAVRGSGSGLTGYPYLGGTATLAPGVDSAASASAAPGHAYRISVDARCYERNTANSEITCNNPGLAKRTQVSVYRDTTGDGNFGGSPLIDFEAFGVNPAQASVPANWKLSFTGSTGGSTNIHEIQGLKICAQFITPPAGYRIQVDNPAPSTCGTPGGTPSSPIVTVTALDTNGNVVTDYDKTITLAATLSGGAASSATWRKVGAGSDLAGNQYTFVPADNGVAQFYLTNSSPQSVFVTVSESGGSLASSLGDPVVYSGGSFEVSNIDTLAGQAGGGVVAGRPHLLQVTRRNGCTVDTSYSGARNLDAWYMPASGDHPSGASAPRICKTNSENGTCRRTNANNPDTGSCYPLLSIATQDGPNIDANTNLLEALQFNSGVAQFCLVTSDVGKYSIGVRDDSSTPVLGASPTLTARPFAVVVSDIKQGTTTNDATGQATDPVFAVAGSNFEARAGGYLYNYFADTGNDGLPDSGATFTQVTLNGLAPRYGDIVYLRAAAYAGGASIPVPALSGGPIVIIGGVGSGTSANFLYPEVGSFQLQAQFQNPALASPPTPNYLNSSVNLTSRLRVYARNNANLPPNDWVGRFRPNHFTLLNPQVTNRATAACSPTSTFTYMGEPIGVGFQLEARNLSGDITRNYAGDWARAMTQYGLGMNATNVGIAGGHTCTVVFGDPNTQFRSCSGGTPPADGTITRTGGRVTVTGVPPSLSWTDGVSAAVSLQAALERADQLDGPYSTVNIGVAPSDTEGTALASFDMDVDANGVNDRRLVGSTGLRFGRLSLSNAAGSDRLPLPVPVRAEYWNGTSFQLNDSDSCTQIAASSLAVFAHAGGITLTNFGGANLPGSAVTLLQGNGRIVLAPPTGTDPVRGSAVICVDLDDEPTPLLPACEAVSLGAPWLQGRWGGPAAFDDDPRARVTFGVHRGGPIIYMREVYR